MPIGRPMRWPHRLEALAALDQAGDFAGLEAALARLPADPPAEALGPLAYWRGKVLLLAERYGEALEPLAEAVQRQPQRVHARYLLGVALARQALWLDAARQLRQALALQPQHAATALELAQVELALGDPAAAVAALEPVQPAPAAAQAYSLWLWRARVRAVPLAQAPALVAAAIQAPQRPGEGLLLEWFQIAAGLLLAGHFDQAEPWLEALGRPGPSLAACSHPFPRRLALLLRFGLALLQTPPTAAAELAAQLRSLLWLPLAERELALWPAVVEPFLHLLRGRLPSGAAASDLAPLADALAALDPAPERTAGERLAWLLSPPSDPLLRHSNDLPRLLELWPQLLAAPNDTLRQQRPALEQALDQLSDQLRHRPNHLVLHPDPALQRQALRWRERGLDLLQQANRRLAELTPARPSSQQPRRRWLLLASDDLPQCVLYRVQQKLEQLSALGGEGRVIQLEALQSWAWSEQLLWAQGVIVCRLPALQPVLRAIAAARQAGLPVLYDIDDLIVDPQHCPPPLATYGGTLQPELHRRFRLDVPLFAAAMASCDGAIVSTPSLAARWRELQAARGVEQPLWVLPNLAPPALQQARRSPRLPARQAPLRLVVASGTTAHKQSWQEELAPALALLLERHSQLQLDLLGHLQLPLVLQPHAARIRCRPFCEYPRYLQQLAEAQIGLVVLEDSPFTDAKSAIRWMEFSHLGLAAVLSPTRTYRELLTEGEHALFARGREAWITAIEQLIASPQQRLALARRAQQHALQQCAPERAEAFWRPWLAGAAARGPVLQLRPSRRRLLLANVFFAPQSIGGATRVLQDQAAALLAHAADRYAITVLCSDHAPWQSSEPSPGSASLPLAIHDWQGARVVRLALPSRHWREHRDPAVAAFCRRWFAQERFDLIHAHCLQVLSASPLEVARELGIPYAVTLHDGWWLSPRQFLITASGDPVDPADPLGHYDAPEQQAPELLAADRQRRRDLAAVLEAASARLAVSAPFAALHRQAGIAAVEVMENRWQPMPAAASRRPRSAAEPLRACFVGGMALHKGLAVLQAAMLQADLPAPGLTLTVVDATLEAGESSGLHWGSTPVRFVPSVPMAAMAAFYAEHDLLIAPSIWPESYGLVTREALSAGLWVVASEIGALAEPIRHGLNGHRIPPRDPAALAAVLAALCRNPPQPQPLLAFPAIDQALADQLHGLYARLLGETDP